VTSHPGGETGSPSVQVREAERAVTPEPLLVEPHLHEGAEASEVWLQTEQEALEYDLQLIAESEGMTMDEARAAFEHSERLDGLLVELGRGFNDVYAGTFTEHEGGTRPTIRIKGPVPADAARLVEAAGDDFTVVGGSPASRVEMKQIAKIASAHFESVGLHASVIVSVSGGRDPGVPAAPPGDGSRGHPCCGGDGHQLTHLGGLGHPDRCDRARCSRRR
jgi:hypothetical protein